MSDLAGLSPEDISRTVQLGLQQQDLQQSSARDLVDAIYKIGFLNTQQIQADTQRLAEWRRIKEIPDKVQVEVKKGEFLEVDPKNALDYYAKINDMPTSYDTYKIAKGDPEFKSYLLEMAKAGKTEINIGETVAKTKAVGKAKQELDMESPTYPAEREKMLMENRAIYNRSVTERADKLLSSNKGMPELQARNIARKTLLADTIINEFKTAYGEDKVSADLVDDVIIIYVDGEIKHRIPL